jgi:hypothetical protein
MKKFTEFVSNLHEAESTAKSELQKSYQEYFKAKLNKFGAKSPADLTPEQKSEFFSEVAKDWEKGQGAKPAGKTDVEKHGVKESTRLSEGKTCSMCKKENCECYKTDEGNKFTGALKKAKDEGKEEFEVDGKTYKVEEHNEGKLSSGSNPLNEGATLYISNPKFKDEASLKADILKKVGPALDNLLARNGVKYNAITAKESRGRIELDSTPLTGKDLGIMQYGFKSVWINSFGGGSFPQINKAAGEAFEFSPYIWFNLHYSYEHGAAWMNSQGSNGCSLYLPSEKSSNVFYDVVEGRFLLESEAARRSDWK